MSGDIHSPVCSWHLPERSAGPALSGLPYRSLQGACVVYQSVEITGACSIDVLNCFCRGKNARRGATGCARNAAKANDAQD